MDAPFSPGAPDAIAPLRAALQGRYEFERELGQGAFATVYLARDLKHERKVAIKVLNADPASDTGELRFIREIRMLARLQHPNILPLHDSGHVEAFLYYVMPYVSGETLRDFLNRSRQLPIRESCIIARDVADALAYAHGEGIIHRDIKPENILMSTGHPIVADFGIARVIDLVAARQLTRTGMGSPGTPAYMSPEQLLGERQIDGRSDTYSLGCVFYEMLAGKPPFAGKEGFVKRFTEPPPDVRDVRRDVPESLNAIVMRALAREPRDRFQSAHDFVDALTSLDSDGYPAPVAGRRTPVGVAAVPASPEATAHQALNYSETPATEAKVSSAGEALPNREVRKRFPLVPLVASLLVVALSLVASRAGSFRSRFANQPLDSARVVVLPLSASDTAFGRTVAERFYDAFRGWTDLSVVADTRVAEMLTQRGSLPQTEDDALAIARSLGAGKLVWGRVSGRGTSARIAVHMFDVANKTSTSELVTNDPGDTKSYPDLLLRLLKPRSWPQAADGGDGLTRSYAAWSAYGRAHEALQEGNLDQAERGFLAALNADPQYAVAHLWLAQIREWRTPAALSAWRDHALRASASNDLKSRDKALAAALVAIGGGDYPGACRTYRALTQTDSTDFAGWFGLGDCQSLDSLVIPSSVSASGWAFRTSNLAAANAYQHAVRLAPGTHAIFNFAKLESLLPTAATRVRFGKSAPPNRIDFIASPSLMGANETLSFVPYPAASFSQRPPNATATLSAAIAKNAAQLLDYTVQWTTASRSDPAAFEALADVLDVRGQIGNESDPTESALSALTKARSLARDSTQILRLATKEAWIRFKRSEFTEAKKLADAALLGSHRQTQADANVLVGLAALTGRARLMAHLSDLSDAAIPSSLSDVSAPVRVAAADFFANSALGVCSAASSSRAALNRAIDQNVAPAATASTSRALVARPLSLLVPCTNGRSILELRPPGDRLTRLEKAYALGRKAEFAALSDSIAARIVNRRPGDLSPDFVYLQSWLRAASGDTAGAIAQLDRSLGALAGVNGSALREPGSAAAIVRAMVLRADLAAKTGSPSTAKKWARAVSILWADADPGLRAEIERMRTLAAAP